MLFESLPERRNQTNAIFFLPVRNLFFGLLKKIYSKPKLCSETSAYWKNTLKSHRLFTTRQVGPEEPFSGRRCQLAGPKSTVYEVSWNWQKSPAGLDQTPLLVGVAHQCLFQSSKFSRRHLSKHPHIPTLFSYPRVPDVIPVPLWMPPAWQLPPLHPTEGGPTSLPKSMCFKAVLK